MNNQSEFDSGFGKYDCETFDFETLSGVFFILIFIISVTVNILLFCVLVTYKKKKVTDLFVLNLACSDLVFTVTLPFYAVYHLHHWIFGDFACKFVTATYFVGTYSNVILMTAMTVDRFITVVLHNWPSNPRKRQRCAMGACAAAWVISMAASISDAIKVKVETTHELNVFFCVDPSDSSDVNVGYYLQSSLLFFLPFSIIVFCYSAILKTVLQASNRNGQRTVVVVLCIVTAFLICWGPYNILLFIIPFYTPIGCYSTNRFETAYSICRILAYSHCCMNPLLYMLSQKLRGHLLKLLRCENARQKNRERSNVQSTSAIQNGAFIAQNSAVMLELPSK